MLTTTTNSLENYSVVEYKGIVKGLIVRSPSLLQGFKGAIQKIFGGNIEAYIEMCEQARQEAFDAMCQHAESCGANAILGIRYDTAELSSPNNDSVGNVTEILCYGTAVVIRKQK